MAVKLNLLPLDYAVSDSVAQVLKISRPLNVILLGIFLVTGLSMAGFFIFSSITIKNLNTTNNTLKRQIQSLQTAQQQVVLLKDRLGKIKKAYTKPSAIKNLNTMEPVLAILPDTASVSELDIDTQKTTVTVNFKTNQGLTNFMTNVSSQTSFSSISLDSFSYGPLDGYLVGFSFIPNTK